MISGPGQYWKTCAQYSRKQTIARHEVDLNEIAIDVSRLVRKDALLRGVELRLMLSASAPKVLADEIPLQQVVLNLITNGMDAMRDLPEDGRVLTVTTCVGTDSELWNDPGGGQRSRHLRKGQDETVCAVLHNQERRPRAWDCRSAVPSSTPSEAVSASITGLKEDQFSGWSCHSQWRAELFMYA